MRLGFSMAINRMTLPLAALFRQQITDRSTLPQATSNLSNTTDTQVGGQFTFTAISNDSELQIVDFNGNAASPSATSLNGLTAVTLRRGFTADGVTYIPLTYKGSRDMVLQPGEIGEWDPIQTPIVKGRGYVVTYLHTWSSAPANFPGSPAPGNGARDLSERGTALTDKTLTGGFTASTRISGTLTLPPITIRGARKAKSPVVALMTDSIGSAGASDADTNKAQRGYAMRGLNAAGIPYVVLGQTSLKAEDVLANQTVLNQYLAGAIYAGATHIYYALGINSAVGRTGAQMYADAQAFAIAAKSAIPGVKVIVATISPKTNVANTAMNGSETATWSNRSEYNRLVRFGNGIGDGYFDFASTVQSMANENLWRVDLLQAATINSTPANGGTNNVSGDIVETDVGLTVQTGGTNGQAATAVSIRNNQGGGFLKAPAVAIEESRQNASLTVFPTTPGSGLQVTIATTSSVPVPTDGLHPTPGMHSYAKQVFLARIKLGLFSMDDQASYIMPTDFGWNSGIKAVTIVKVAGKYVITENPRDLVNASIWSGPAYYVNVASGNNSNAGTSEAAPVKAIAKAVDLLNKNSSATGGRIFIVGEEFDRTVDWVDSGNSNALQGIVPQKHIAYIGVGKRPLIGPFATLSWTSDNGSYIATRSAVLRVMFKDASGKFTIEAVNRTTQAAVDGGDGYYQHPAGDATYPNAIRIRRPDGAAVTNDNTKVIVNGSGYIAGGNNVDIYMENLEGLGASGPNFDFRTAATRTIIMVDVEGHHPGTVPAAGVPAGSGQNVFSFNNLQGFAGMWRCRGYAGTADVFNGHGDTNQAQIMTVDCVGFDSGRANNTSNQGLTTHDALLWADLNGEFYGNAGGNIRNIENSKMLLLNTYLHDDRGDQIFGGDQPPTDIVLNNNAKLYGVGVRASGTARSIQIDANAAAYMKDFSYTGTVTGTVSQYPVT